MVSPPMKKRTVTAAYASAAAWCPSPSELSASKDMYIKKADAATTPTQAAAAAAPDGLDLLFAASQAETKLRGEESDASGAGAGDGAKVPSTITVVSNEPVAGDDESRDNEPENLATAALESQDKSFPQILHEILVIPECQSIFHWLPDGLSFIMADKERFSSVILPKYFREALLNSFIRKLNRWGFRRVKSRRKGEESSFAHSNFVRDKPWLCLRMKCKSKPTYHKVKVSSTKKKKNNKKNKTMAKQSTSEASNRNILANAANASVVVHAPAQAPRLPPPPFLAARGIMSRTFVPTSTYSRATTSAEHEALPLSNHEPALLTAPAADSRAATAASIIQERQYLASIPLYHQQRIFHERQIHIAQMRQWHQVQMELQRLSDMSSHIGDQIASSRNGSVQSARMAQYQYARDTWNSRNIYYGGERK